MQEVGATVGEVLPRHESLCCFPFFDVFSTLLVRTRYPMMKGRLG